METKRSVLIYFGWILFIAQPVFAQQAINTPISDAIINVAGYDEKSQPVSSGIAIVLKDSGIIITSYHLLAGATDLVFSKHNKIIKTSGIDRVNVEQDIVVLKIANTAKKKFPSVSLGSASVGEKVLISGKKDDGSFFTTETLLAAPEISEGRTDGLNSFTTPVENGFVVSDLQGNLTGIISPLKKGNTKSNYFIPIQEVFSFRKMPGDSVYSKSNFLLYQGLTAYDEENYNSAHDFLSAYIKLVKNDAAAYYYRGKCQFELKNFMDALADHMTAAMIDSGNPRFYKACGITCRMLKKYPEAIDYLNKAIDSEPHDYEMYLNRGISKGRLKKGTEAISDYNRAIELRPESGEAWYYLGSENLIILDYSGAATCFDKAIWLEFKNAAVYYNRGIANINLNYFNRAFSDFETAINLDPELMGAYLNRGNLKFNMGDMKGALDDFNRTIQLNENYADAYHNRGNVKAKLNDFEGAIADYNQAIRLFPENGETYNVRANAKFALGDILGACSDWSKAGELGIHGAYAIIKEKCRQY